MTSGNLCSFGVAQCSNSKNLCSFGVAQCSNSNFTPAWSYIGEGKWFDNESKEIFQQEKGKNSNDDLFDILKIPCLNISSVHKGKSLMFEWYVLDREKKTSRYYQKIVSIKDKTNEEIIKIRENTRWDGGSGCAGIGEIGDSYFDQIKNIHKFHEF